MPGGATLFDIVCELIKNILPGSTLEQCVRYAKQRVACAEKADTWHDEISACDEAQEVLEKSDAQAVRTEQKKAVAEKQEYKDFLHAFTRASRRVAEDNRQPNQTKYQKQKADLKKKYNKKNMPDLPPSNIPVIAARQLVPPGASLWQDDKYGSWQGHYPPYPRRGRAWRKWGEGMALKLVLKYLWAKYLCDEGWDTDMCPVGGIFEPGASVEDLV